MYAMEIVRTIVIVAVLSLGCYTSARALVPVTPQQEQHQDFGVLEGTWEGAFETRSPTPEGHTVSSQVAIRLVLEDGVARIFAGQGGLWKEVEPGRFTVEFLGTNALIYLVHAGKIPTPEGSRWFEIYLLAVAAKTDDSLLGRWVRVVNHLDTAPNDPNRTFTVDGEVTLKKVVGAKDGD